MKRWLGPWLILALASGCSNSENAFLFIETVAAPDATCIVQAEPNESRSRGAYDFFSGSTFSFTPVVVNNLNPTVSNNQTFFNDDALFPEGNNVTITGFDVCYIRGDDPRVSEFSSAADGFPVDCEDDSLPGEFVAASATIPPASRGGFFVEVLSDSALQTLFGADFDPDEIPLVLDPSGTLPVGRQSPEADPRSDAWGTFPAASSALVYVISRAVGARNNGDSVRTDFFAYGVDLIPNFVANFCAPLLPVTCPDGTMGVEGEVIDEAGSCVPSSNFGLACQAFTTCEN